MADQTTLPEGDDGQSAWACRVPPRLGEITMAVALIGAAVFFIWQSALLPFGNIRLPGPGFFPFALGIALGLFALAILYGVVKDTVQADAIFIGHRDVLILFAALMGIPVTFEWLGAYVSLGVFTAVLLIVLARTTVWRAGLGAVLGMGAVWVVFKVLLGVQLPAGPF